MEINDHALLQLYAFMAMSDAENFRSERARVTSTRFGGRCVNVVAAAGGVVVVVRLPVGVPKV
jgi:hypothetical protein